MKRILYQTFIITFFVIISLAVPACKNIFHSKENMYYMSLTIGEERSGGPIDSSKRDYYIFEAEQGVKYSITVTRFYTVKGNYDNHYKDEEKSDNDVDVAVFCYDTEEALLKEAVGSFTAPRSGKIVIRISRKNYTNVEKYTLNVKLM